MVLSGRLSGLGHGFWCWRRAVHVRHRRVGVVTRAAGAAQMRALAEMENSGLVPLLMADRAEDLARMHALFARVDGGSELLRAGMVRTMHGMVDVLVHRA